MNSFRFPLSKIQRNIPLFILMILFTISFNNTASAQWVINSGDGSGHALLNYDVIRLNPGESYTGTVTSLMKLIDCNASINSSVPYFGGGAQGRAAVPSPINTSAISRFHFSIAIPPMVFPNQINYRMTFSGNYYDSNNVIRSVFFIIDVKPRLGLPPISNNN